MRTFICEILYEYVPASAQAYQPILLDPHNCFGFQATYSGTNTARALSCTTS